MSRAIVTLVCGWVLAGLLAPVSSLGQDEAVDYIEVKIDLDSGYVENCKKVMTGSGGRK